MIETGSTTYINDLTAVSLIFPPSSSALTAPCFYFIPSTEAGLLIPLHPALLLPSFFTILMWLPRGRARHSVTLFLIILSERSRGESASIDWLSPSNGTIFGPGDTIIGNWTATKAIISPSFSLCMPNNSEAQSRSTTPDETSEDGCGSAIWPTVEQDAGSYMVSIAVPNVTDMLQFHLKVKDDSGKLYFSPPFYLSPTPVVSGQATGGAGQAPFALPPQSSSASATGSASSSPPTSASVSTLLTRHPAPTAVFAVPLSIVGAILLIATGLSFRHRRSLAQERVRDTEKLAMSRKSSTSSFKSASEVEYALNVLARNDILAKGHMPVPLFMPAEHQREERQSTRQPFRAPAVEGTHCRSNTVYSSRASSVRSLPRTQYLPPICVSPNPTETNVPATHVVLGDYLQPSPVPPNSLLAAPQRLYTRSEALNHQQYTYEDKPLPRSPGRETADIYDAVATNIQMARER